MQEDPTKPYDACPYCLTRIDGKPIEPEASQPTLPQKLEQLQEKLKQISFEQKPHTCRFHMGYLSERVQKEEVPEDCLLCKNMVECMLRKMRE